MSVVGFREMWDGRDGDENQNGVITYTRVFQIETDSASDTQAVVQSYHELPAKFAPHPANPLLTARRIRSSQDTESPLFWRVEVEYSNEVFPVSNSDFQNQTQSINPLDREAKIRWGFAQYQEAINYDIDNQPIWNTAFDFYEGVTRDQSRPVITITKNMDSVPPWILKYPDAINSDDFVIDGIQVVKWQAKCQSVQVSEKRRENNVVYRQVTIEIHLRHEIEIEEGFASGWTLMLVDEGFRKLEPKRNADGSIIQGRYVWANIDVEGHSTTKPVLLDGSTGAVHPDVLAGFQPGVEVEPFFLQFDIYQELPFAILPGVGV